MNVTCGLMRKATAAIWCRQKCGIRAEMEISNCAIECKNIRRIVHVNRHFDGGPPKPPRIASHANAIWCEAADGHDLNAINSAKCAFFRAGKILHARMFSGRQLEYIRDAFCAMIPGA